MGYCCRVHGHCARDKQIPRRLHLERHNLPEHYRWSARAVCAAVREHRSSVFLTLKAVRRSEFPTRYDENEGIGRQLDPGLDLFKSALPILRQLGRQMSTQEGMKQLPSGEVGAFLKVRINEVWVDGWLTCLQLWVWMEARELASAAFVNADDLVKYDWYSPAYLQRRSLLIKHHRPTGLPPRYSVHHGRLDLLDRPRTAIL